MNIRILVLGLLLFGFLNSSFGQKAKSKDPIKLEKQKAKNEQKKKENAEWMVLKKMIDDKEFVFTGNSFGGTSLDPKINFLYINGDEAMIQFSNGFGGGPNGIGGITTNGSIITYNVSAKKTGKAIKLKISFNPKLGQGVRGPITLFLNVFSFDSAQLNFGSREGSMAGEIKTRANSKIFVGNKLN